MVTGSGFCQFRTGVCTDDMVKQAMIYTNIIACNLSPKIMPTGNLAILLWLLALAQINIAVSCAITSAHILVCRNFL